MLGIGALAYFASGPAQSHIFSVFITPISEDLGLTRASVSSAYALATLVAAFGLPYVGRLIDRFGVRRVLIVIVIAFVLAQAGFRSILPSGERQKLDKLREANLARAFERMRSERARVSKKFRAEGDEAVPNIRSSAAGSSTSMSPVEAPINALMPQASPTWRARISSMLVFVAPK